MACVERYNSSTWFFPDSTRPDFASSYSLGSGINLAWWGNIPHVVGQTQDWNLILAWFSDTDADSASFQGHTTEITSTDGWEFVYGARWNPSWTIEPTSSSTNGDACGDTQLGVGWGISPDIDISSNQKFKIFGLNLTDPNDITTVTSPGFSLLPVSTSPILSSVAATTSSSTSEILSIPATTRSNTSETFSTSATTSSSSSTSRTSSTPATTYTTTASTSSAPIKTTPPSLSTGVKAGIGVGCSLLACCILLGVFFFVRRRKQQKADKWGSSAFQKNELDGTATGKSIPELGGEERHGLAEQLGIAELEESRNVEPLEMG